MRKTVLASACILFAAGILVSCNNKKKDSNSGPGDTPATATALAASTEPADGKKGMTVAEAKDFLDADAANSGKEVTVSAYCWGSNERTDNMIQLNLGDKKLEGMQSASFYCLFPKAETDAIKAIAKDAMVTVSGKIASGSGGVELTECKLIQ